MTSSFDSWPSLEAQIAAIADDIAYDNHDIDDGLRSGVLQLDALLELPFIRRVLGRHRSTSSRAWTGAQAKGTVRDGIGTMVGDVLAETRRRIREAGVETIDEVRAAGRQLAGFSSEMQEAERALKRHLYAHLYDSDALRPIRLEAQRIVSDLARYFIDRVGACRTAGNAARAKRRGCAASATISPE